MGKKIGKARRGRTASRSELLGQVETLRLMRGLSKTELAVRAGMNSSYVRRTLTRFPSNVKLSTVTRLADALGYVVVLRES